MQRSVYGWVLKLLILHTVWIHSMHGAACACCPASPARSAGSARPDVWLACCCRQRLGHQHQDRSHQPGRTGPAGGRHDHAGRRLSTWRAAPNAPLPGSARRALPAAQRAGGCCSNLEAAGSRRAARAMACAWQARVSLNRAEHATHPSATSAESAGQQGGTEQNAERDK